MWARITSVGTDPASGLAYLHVEFWPDQAARDGGEPPALVNDFLFSRPESYRAHLVDADGQWTCQSGAVVSPYVEVDGEWRERPEDPSDPYAWTTVMVDVAGEAVQMISDFAARQADTRGDLSDPHVIVGPPAGIAARNDMQSLVGSEREV